MSEQDNVQNGLANNDTTLPRRSVLRGAGIAMGGSLLATSTQAQPQSQLQTQQQSAPVPQVGNPSTPAYNPSTEYVFTIYATISEAMTVGPTTRGQIRAIPITGGEVEGENIRGRVVPGGADWQRSRADGITEIEATYAIELEDKTLVKVINRGIIDAQSPPEDRYFRTAVRFEAPQGPHQWLNEAIFLCKAGLHPTRAQTVQVEVFKLV